MLNLKTNNSYIFLVCLFAIKMVHLRQYPDYTNHPCMRPCNKQTSAMTCQYEWTLTRHRTMGKECECEIPGNCRRPNWSAPSCIPANGIGRSVLTINRRLPGPSIQVCNNDVIRVRLENDLDSMETSIHWHGILQRGTPYMDGISRITQCAINAGSTFIYEFLANDTGTHLFHSHSGIQRADGLFGAIIVRDKNDLHSTLYDFDLPEHVVIFNDWITTGTAQEKLDAFKYDRKDIFEPEAILINGRGTFKEATTEQMAIPRNVFKVSRNKRYRFRFISAGVLACPLQISIQDHKFSVIASDGQDLEPENDVEALTIFAGERYDIVLNANQRVGNYWFRVKGLGGCATLEVFEIAVLNYNGQNLPSPLARDELDYQTLIIRGKQVNNVEETDVQNNKKIVDLRGKTPKALIYNEIRHQPDKKFFFELEFTNHRNTLFDTNPQITDPDLFIFSPQINNISMEMPKIPLLTNWNSINKNLVCNSRNRERVCAEHIKKRLVCRCIHVIEVDLNDLVEFVIVDATRFPLPVPLTPKHPMHLHGHKFAVTAMYDFPEEFNRSNIDTVNHMRRSGMVKLNLDSPPVKDTVALPNGGFAILRFVANNPGVWLFHCHIDLHADLGMLMAFKVGQTSQFPLPPPNFPTCGSMEPNRDPVRYLPPPPPPFPTTSSSNMNNKIVSTKLETRSIAGYYFKSWQTSRPPTDTNLSVCYTGSLSIVDALRICANKKARLPGSKFLSFGGNGAIWSLSALKNLDAGVSSKRLAEWNGIVYDIVSGNSGLAAAFATSFANAKSNGLLVLVTFSHSQPKRILDASILTKRFLSNLNIDYLSPRLFTQGTETENDYTVFGTTWSSYASSKAKLVPSVILGSRDYPAALNYFSQNYGISLYGYLQWNS